MRVRSNVCERREREAEDRWFREPRNSFLFALFSFNLFTMSILSEVRFSGWKFMLGMLLEGGRWGFEEGRFFWFVFLDF